MKLSTFALAVVATLLCSCAATSVKRTWTAPDFKPPVGKIAVVAVEDRGLVREGFENRLVAQLKRAGNPAVATFDLLSLEAIKQDKRAAAERMQAVGSEALLIMRLADSTTAYREVRAGKDRFAGVITGFDTTGWYNYYEMAFVNMNSTYGNLKQTVYVETSLYEFKTGKRIWSGVTQTVLKEGMDRVAEMDPLVEKIVAAMKKDGVVP